MYIVSYSSNRTITCKAEEALSVRIGPVGPVDANTPIEKIDRLIEVEVDKTQVIAFKVREEDLEYWEASLLGTSGAIITLHDFSMALTEHLLKAIKERKEIMSVVTLRYYIGHLVGRFEEDKKRDSRVKFGK